MMTVNSLRILFVLICCTTGYFVMDGLGHKWQGVFTGFLLSIVIFAIEFIIRKVAVRDLVAGIVGLFGGLLLSLCFFAPVAYFMAPGLEKTLVSAAVFLMLPYLGIILAIKKKDELFLWRSRTHAAGTAGPPAVARILDTSVIIDGRIGDICQTHFLDGTLVIPRFVLGELQQIADSTEPVKRNRGRRGLDTLNAIQKSNVVLEITDEDYPHLPDVDAKLIQLAKDKKAQLITTDFNLNKVAELQGIAVLNVNDLANAIKPVVIPGEEMDIRVVKEGKEANQGLAYLDDGTMIVVENGKPFINQTVHIAITSVLQTAAGRMIFAKRKS
jgi:uncharacterized protein YacL